MCSKDTTNIAVESVLYVGNSESVYGSSMRLKNGDLGPPVLGTNKLDIHGTHLVPNLDTLI